MNTTEKNGNPLAELDNMYKLLDMHVEEARPEYSRVTMPITQKVKNGMGIAHGGAIFTLADIAFGAACNSDARTGVVSLSTSFQFLAPGREWPLVAEARLVRGGKHVVTYDVDVKDAGGILVAHCTAQGYRTDFPFVKKV